MSVFIPRSLNILYFKKIIFICISLIYTGNSIHATSNVSSEKPSQSIEKSELTRKNIRQQCSEYRTVWDPVFFQVKEMNPEASLSKILYEMSRTHTPDLFSFFKDIMTDAKMYLEVHEDKITQVYNFKNQKLISILHPLARIAIELCLHEKFTPAVFTSLNITLAHVISLLKGEIVFGKDFPPIRGEKSLYINFFNSNGIRQAWEERYLAVLDNKRMQRPICFIYAHPNPERPKRGISKQTFVDQYVGKEGLYPLWIAFFDLHCNIRENSTKKDPHFSCENGTLRMVKHDIDHIPNIDQEESSKIFYRIKEGYKIVQELRKQERFNDAALLGEVLFNLFREGSIFIISNKDTKLDSDSSDFEKLKCQLVNFFNQAVRHRDKRSHDINLYKREYRDLESILKCKNQRGQPFLSTVTMYNEKERSLPIAKQGDKYIIIQKPEDFNQENMSWVMKNADTPQNIQQERDEHLNVKIKEGYKRVAQHACDLIDEYSEKL